MGGETKSLDALQVEMISKFTCKPEWPICLFDFTYKNKIPSHFCFKTELDLTSLVKEDYFGVD